MAVTAASLAAALGITGNGAETEGERLLSIAGALVDAYLRGATDCPEAIRDEATIRTAGHVRKGRAGFGRVEGRFEVGEAITLNLTPAARSAVRQSGAAALLAPWVKRTA